MQTRLSNSSGLITMILHSFRESDTSIKKQVRELLLCSNLIRQSATKIFPFYVKHYKLNRLARSSMTGMIP